MPLVSVVIPTFNRPRLLARAIDSALGAASDKDVEVIVVPNGPSRSWKAVAEARSRDPRIQWRPIENANGNVARNEGLQIARGEYVRFLDDDDFLYPENAVLQNELLVESGADLSTGALAFVDESCGHRGHYSPCDGDDFVAEVFQQRPSTMVQSHLYRSRFLDGLSWNPERRYLQDVEWTHQLIRRGEVNWMPFRQDVGAWVHHDDARVSVGVAKALGEERLAMGAEIIGESIKKLDATGRLNDARRRCAAKALWDYAHHGFTWSPRKWLEIARWARTLDPKSRPAAKVMNYPVVKSMNPIFAELLLFPARAMLRKSRIVDAP